MPHGAKDWSKYGPGSDRYSLQDLGELAARLGSIDVYDRRGELVWWEDWSGGVNRWGVSGVGSGYEVILDASVRYLSHYVARMTTGAGAGGSVAMYMYLSPLHLKSVGLEVSIVAHTDFGHINLSLYRYDGSVLTKSSIRLSNTDSEFLYLDENDAYVAFATGLSIPVVSLLFHQLKLVVNLETDQYVRAFFNETEYDLSGIAARTEADATSARTYLALELVRSPAVQSIHYCGHVLVTSNEP